MKKYHHQTIEKKWQKKWEQEKLGRVKDFPLKPKFYCLDMFPYPSAQGLHVGHPEGYTATDILTRYRWMKGYEVLHPMGWDAFGLPAENYALKTGIQPAISTARNIKNIKRQIKRLGFAYDWSREINTTDPNYYHWTQWIFLQLFKHGLAYEALAPINWCPSCKTGLANEEVIAGECERCGTEVTRKNLKQWLLRITAYADRLLEDLEGLDWEERIKEMQRNWIGRSEGAEVIFPLQGDYNFVLLHGFNGSPEDIFFPWLKKKLKGLGYKFSVPQLPHPDQPTEKEQVDHVLKQVRFDEKTILFGHSLGAAVALKVLEKLDRPIAGLVLAGGFVEPRFKDRPRPFHQTFNWNFDFEKIKKNIGWAKILSARNDYAVPLKQGQILAESLSGQLIETESREPHFTGSEEPVILEQLIPQIKVFTTRPDTLFGATYLVVAPEHPLLEIKNQKLKIKNIEEVKEYIEAASSKSDLERTELTKEKTGVELKGLKAVNPVNGEEIPIWVADYVLASYGTGAIMAVPAHDARDFEFARKFNLPIREVISGGDISKEAYEDVGVLINSSKFSGFVSTEAKAEITNWLEAKDLAKKSVHYKLRDWVFSRQRYWGEPIPIIKCDQCGNVPLEEKDLPLKLPRVKEYKPTGTGESPLASIEKWVKVRCPKCRGWAQRETNTMPQWAGSSWYWLRYIDPENQKKLADEKKLAAWLPVDLYVGGAEHAVLHLLYARFWNKFLVDIGAVPKVKLPSGQPSDEPFYKLRNQGIILGEDGEKMSKSRGNVINPDEVVEQYGADTFRLYEMFMGPFADPKPWSTKGIVGIRRFLEKIWNYFDSWQLDYKKDIKANKKNSELYNKDFSDERIQVKLHKTIKKVTEDIESFKFNTAIAALMIFVNEIRKESEDSRSGFLEETPITILQWKSFLRLLAPFAPHLAEELWEKLGEPESIFKAAWPKYELSLVKEEKVEVVIQVNGKVRDRLMVETEITEDELKKLVLASAKIQPWLAGREPKKIIYIKGRLISIVV